MPPANQTQQTFQSINQGNPPDHGSQETRRQARSHAARSGHARLRRLRTLQHQAEQAELEKGVQVPPLRDTTGGIGGYWDVCDRDGTVTSTSSGGTSGSPETRRGVFVPRPSSTSIPTPGMRDPFLSYRYTFTPLEDYLFQHYMAVVIPYINAFCYKMGRFHLDLLSITSDWVRIGLTDPQFRNTIYLAACRHLWKTQHKNEFQNMSMQFKIACMRELNSEITMAVPINNTLIAKTVMLSWDELTLGDIMAAATHMKAALRMLELRADPGDDTGYVHTFLSEAVHSITTRPRPAHLPGPDPELTKMDKHREPGGDMSTMTPLPSDGSAV